MKTLMPKQVKDTDRKWYVVDAKGKTLGRLSTELATILKGKNKLDFSGHVDNGDYIIVLNADKFKVTGSKLTDKIYYRHSGYMGGLKATTLQELLDKKPLKVIEKSVAGMLPKNKLRKNMLSRLKIYEGTAHPHEAQKPEELSI